MIASNPCLIATCHDRLTCRQLDTCKGFCIHGPDEGVSFFDDDGLDSLERVVDTKAVTFRRRSPWAENPSKMGVSDGVLVEKTGQGWVSKGTQAVEAKEVRSRAEYEASMLDECCAFAIHPSKGVQFYNEDAFNDDGELSEDAE